VSEPQEFENENLGRRRPNYWLWGSVVLIVGWELFVTYAAIFPYEYWPELFKRHLGKEESNWFRSIFLGTLFGQPIFLSWFAATWGTTWRWRVLILGALLPITHVLNAFAYLSTLLHFFFQIQFEFWFITAVLLTLLTTFATLFYFLLPWRLQHHSELSLKLIRNKFSLAHLFVFTTIAAVVMGIFNYLPAIISPEIVELIASPFFWIILGGLIVEAIASLFIFLIVCGAKRSISYSLLFFSVGLTIFAVEAAVLILQSLNPPDYSNLPGFLVGKLALYGSIALPAFIVRQCGYILVRPPKRSA
jgi:MFS family permease